ncbi:hypothetical protein GOBAR_DD26217 [Gossypium barbadense]|nr:hypothetical protein GOBAR_DD26217 [Gossypium barbadense]
MKKVAVFVLLLVCTTSQIASSAKDGLLPNGNFEQGPKASELKGTKVMSGKSIPNREISGYVEYIKSGQKQDDMLLIVPQGAFAVRLGNGTLIKQKIRVIKGDSLTDGLIQQFAANLLKNGNFEEGPYIFPILTSEGLIIPPEIEDDHSPLPGWIIESLKAIKYIDSEHLSVPQGKWAIELIAGKESAVAQIVKTTIGRNYVLSFVFPPEIEDDHSPLPGWIIESLKAIKYIDSEHLSVPQGKWAIELIAGKESAVAQIVKTTIGRNYVLSFVVGDANDGCEGPMMVEAFAGKNMVMVSYNSKGKGGFKAARLAFRAESTRTRIMFYSTIYTIKSDNSGSLCGPVLDDVKLLSVRKLHDL